MLLTVRDEAASSVAERVADHTGTTPHRVVVGELLDAEMAQVLQAFPALAPLGRNPRASALLLRRPYLIELLIRAVARSGLPPTWSARKTWSTSSRPGWSAATTGGLPGRGAPEARCDTFLALADAAIANTLPARLEGQDAEARAGLRSDDVITPTRNSWRFAHDVLADYAVATRLMEPGGDTLLAQAPAPRRLLRALRLRMQRQLADPAGRGILPAIWAQLLGEADRFAGTDGPRWKDLPWEALLHLGTIRDALPVLRGQLPAEHGAGLLRLVDVAERLARRPGSDEQPGPLPVELALSGPVIDLLAQLGNEVPEPVRPRAARLVHAHLEAAVASGGDSAAELDDAAELPDTLRSWLGDDRRGDLFDHVVGSLALLGTHLAARHEEFLAEHARRQPDAVAEPVESPWVSGALARSRPHLLLRLAGLFYLGVGLTTDGRTEDVGRRPRSTPGSSSPLGGDDFDDDLEGVREHDLRQSNHLPMFPLGNNQSNPALGPFAALLAADPARGLRLIGAVVDAATAARAGLQADHPLLEDEPPSVALTLSTPPDVWRFTGPNAVWLWHRRTSVGPGPALSALMALRAWASGQIREGARAATVRDTVLGAGTSLAFPAVALSVLVENIDAVHDELDRSWSTRWSGIWRSNARSASRAAPRWTCRRRPGCRGP